MFNPEDSLMRLPKITNEEETTNDNSENKLLPSPSGELFNNKKTCNFGGLIR